MNKMKSITQGTHVQPLAKAVVYTTPLNPSGGQIVTHRTCKMYFQKILARTLGPGAGWGLTWLSSIVPGPPFEIAFVMLLHHFLAFCWFLSRHFCSTQFSVLGVCVWLS